MSDIRETIRRLDELEDETVLDKLKKTDVDQQETEPPPTGWTVVIEATRYCIEPVAVEAVMYGANKSQDQAQAIVTASAWTRFAPVHTYSQRDVAESVAQRISNHAAANRRYDDRKPRNLGQWVLPTHVRSANES